ncbi:hypothetical protein PHBOTO_005614 [Pseudozyma hubeiensis]|nr:hypothetical protein PHBOTO_005614 [Pseudozyma hubeiensis]
MAPYKAQSGLRSLGFNSATDVEVALKSLEPRGRQEPNHRPGQHTAYRFHKNARSKAIEEPFRGFPDRPKEAN